MLSFVRERAENNLTNTMSYGVSLHVWGEYACFTRPELKAERVSYEVMTPAAARGILSAVYWKPEFRWVIDRIRVLKPIRTMQVRRNEVGDKAVKPPGAVLQGLKTGVTPFFIEARRQQRAATILKDVGYVIEAHVEVVHEADGINDVAKHLEVFKRRARKGQCFYQPCLGVREFPAMFELVEDASGLSDELFGRDRNRSLGLIFHDMVYQDDKKGEIVCAHTHKAQTAIPHFFMAELKNGVMVVPALSKTLY